MARSVLGSILNRDFRNELNRMLEELYSNILLFNDGTKFIENKHIADNAINGFKIMDNSINRRHMRDGSIDEDNLTDQMKKVLKDTQIMSFSQNFKEVKIEFELGGWGVLGEKITGDNPKQLRSNVPVYLPSSSLIKPDSSLIQYEYTVIYHNGRGEYIKRSNWTNFATEMRVNEDAIVYINIRKKDDTIMTSEDAENVQNSFNSVRLADAKPTESNNIKFNFEAGGWSSNGAKLTTINPSSVRATNSVRLHKGTIINTKYSGDYEFDVFRVINGVLTSQRGFRQFGNNFYINETDEYFISNRREDGQPISKEDIDIINGLYNENLNYNDEVYSDLVNPKFEPGGWLTTGVKVTSTTPVKVRSITPYYLKEGSVISTGGANKYYFNIMNIENGTMVSLVEKNKFGEPFIITQTGHYYISVGKVEETPMALEDAFEISSLFNPIMYHMSINENKKADNKFNVVGELSNFITNNLINHFENPNTIDPQTYHDATIQLVNNNNDVATYENLGKDSYGYNLYKYEIKPQIMKFSKNWATVPREGEGNEIKVPKVILTAGIHGQERSASYVLYHFMNHLLENPEDNPVFDTLRNNVHFIFIPICCPSGFADNTYESRSGMNMNRDFPPHGEITQPETGYVKNVLDDNSDADYHIDFHNFRPYDHNDDILGYSLTDDIFMRRLTTNAYKFVGQKWQKKEIRLPQNRLHQWGYTAAANIGTVGKYSNDVLGIPSTIIETPLNMVMLNEDRHESNVTQIGVDILSNLIISIVEARR